MKKPIVYLIILLIVTGCRKDKIELSEVFTEIDFSKEVVEADGQSTVTATVKLKEDASPDRRNVVFKITGGTFLATSNEKATIRAEYEGGELLAKVKFRPSTVPGTITVSAEPEFDNQSQDFVISKTISSTKSVPESLKLETSGFAISSNFSTEVLLTASLRNKDNRYVSKGYKILFDDELSVGTKAMGRYRFLQSETLDSSKVTVKYAAAGFPIGTNIKIRCTLLDAEGKRTAVRDSLFLTINL
jgi:hypothetical protein